MQSSLSTQALLCNAVPSRHPGSVENDLNPADFISAFVLQKQGHNIIGLL